VFTFEQSSAFSDSMLKTWNRSSSSQPAALEEVFRQGFTRLTADFLRPFDPYTKIDVRPLMLNPFQIVTELPSFNSHVFMKSLTGNGFLRTLSSTKLVRLYEKFISTSTFTNWLASKREQASREMAKDQIKFCLSASDNVISSLANFELAEGIDRLAELCETEDGLTVVDDLITMKHRLEEEQQSRSRHHQKDKKTEITF